MARDCYYKLTITCELCPYDIWFPEPVHQRYLGRFTWAEVLREVQAWYDRGADAVELKKITQEQFDKLPPSI